MTTAARSRFQRFSGLMALLVAGVIISACGMNVAGDHQAEKRNTTQSVIHYAKPSPNPATMSEKEFAKWLVDASSIKLNPKDSFAGVVKWSGPLRVSIQDGRGRDLNLTTIPGKTIKNYINWLAKETLIPITIVKKGQRNNVSIVVVTYRLDTVEAADAEKGMRFAEAHGGRAGEVAEFLKNQFSKDSVDEIDAGAGRILGVPELDKQSRLFKSMFSKQEGWYGHNFEESDATRPDAYWKFFRDKYEIKACKILLWTSTLPWEAWRSHATLIGYNIKRAMLECLGLHVSDEHARGRFPMKRLRMLYSEEISPGMDARKAEQVFLRGSVKQ